MRCPQLEPHHGELRIALILRHTQGRAVPTAKPLQLVIDYVLG
jgi:hypothetical protein